MADSNGGSRPSVDIPDDVVLEVIARLPLKRATQCSLLNRNIRRCISQPQFRQYHAALTSRAATIFHCSASTPKVFTRFCNESGSQRLVCLKETTSIIASCNGILLLCINSEPHRKHYVFNPTTGGIRPVNIPATANVALAVDFDDSLFKLVTAVAADTKPDQTSVRFSVFVPGTGRSMSLKSQDQFSSARRFTLEAADNNIQPVYAAGSMYWLGGDARVTVSFELTRRNASFWDGPVTDVNRTGDMWFGYAGGSVRFVHSLQEEILIYGLDHRNGWRVDRKIANISGPSNNDYKFGQCINFNGGRLFFVLRIAGGEGRVFVYDLSREKWEISGWRVRDWADRHQQFFSIIPTSMKVSDLYLHDLNLKEETVTEECPTKKAKGSSFNLGKMEMVKDFVLKEKEENRESLLRLHKLLKPINYKP